MGKFTKVHGKKSAYAREMKRTGGMDMAGKKKGKGKKKTGGMNRQKFIDRAEDALGDQPL